MSVNALQMNLSALQRQDRAITAISETSPQVTLYCFDASLRQWSRTEIEGSLFICKRSVEPKCCLIILNKKDPRNHKENITKSLELQVQEKFLLYKSTKGAVYGLWFYDDKECSRVAASLQKIISSLDGKTRQKRSSVNGGNTSPNPQRSSSKPIAQRNGQSNILTMLTQAQQRYEEDRKRQHSPTQSSPQETSSTIVSGAGSNQSAPVIQLSNGNGKSIKILQKPKESPENEKSDSVVPSADSSFMPFSPISTRMCPVQQPVDVKNGSETTFSPMATTESSPIPALDSPFTPIKPDSPSPPSSELSLTFASNLLTPELLTMSLADHQDENMLNFQAPQSNDALLSPEALLSSPVSTNSLPTMSQVPSVITELLLSESSGAISPTASARYDSDFLSRDQLRSALISLIQTDEEFVTKLHDAYVRRCVYSAD